MTLLWSFLVKTITNWKVLLVIAVMAGTALAGKYIYNLGVTDTERRLEKLPGVRDTVTVIKHDTIPAFTVKYLQGETIHDTVDLSQLTRQRLEEAAKPFAITEPITVTDDQRHVGVSFDMQFKVRPLTRSVEDFVLSNIVSTYPRETVTETRYVPMTPHTFDLFIRGSFGNAWAMPLGKAGGGLADAGIQVNIDALKLKLSPFGAAFIRREVVPVYSITLEITTE